MRSRSLLLSLASLLGLWISLPAAALTTFSGEAGGVTDPAILSQLPFFSTPCPANAVSADCLAFVGNIAAGSAEIDGGSSLTVGGLVLGAQSGADGTLRIEGAGSQVLLAGDDADQDVAVLWAGGIAFGIAPGPPVTATATLQVLGGGRLRLESGPHASGDQGNFIHLGSAAGSVATATVAGAGSAIEVVDTGADALAAGINVGFEGQGELTVSQGALVHVDTGSAASPGDVGGITIGGNANPILPFAGGTGTMSVTGPGSRVEIRGAESGIAVGGRSVGSLTVSDQAVVQANAGIGVGQALGSSGTAVIDGAGTLVTADGLIVGNEGTGSLAITGGAQASFALGSIVGALPTGNGSLVVDGAGTELDAGAALLVGKQLDGITDGGVAQAIVQNGGLITSELVVVGSQGTLAGNGTVQGNVVNDGGRIAPGLSPGTLTIAGDLVMSAGVLEIELNGSQPGELDVLEVLGAVTFVGGDLRLLVDPSLDLSGGLDVDFLIALDVAGIANLNVMAFQDGVAVGVDVSSTGGGLRASLVPEPEPAVGLLLAVGIVALLRSRRAR